MNKRLAVLVLMLLILAVGIMLPEHLKEVTDGVVKQHEAWPKESPEATGLDESGNLSTHLPLIILRTQGQEIPGALGRTAEDLCCEYAIIDNPNGVNRSGDEPTQTGRMAISIRGNSSRQFPKKQYAVKLVDDVGLPVKQALLGMPAESTWVLNGSYIDHSQIRNYMMYTLSGEIMDYAPRCRLAEVMLTDAQGNMIYQGLYTLIEKPKVSEARLNLAAYDPAYRETSFLIQMNAYIEGIEIPHLMPEGIPVVYRSELKYPDSLEVTASSADYIRAEMLDFEKALYDADHTGDWSRVESMTDLESFVDYYIINEFFQNYDAGRRSTYLHKGLGGKIVMGPVWDFDSAFDNFVHAAMGNDWLDVKTTIYYHYLTKCPAFVEQVSKRYVQLRNSILSEENLLEFIDGCNDYLGTAVDRNCDQWYAGDRTLYDEDITSMKDFVIRRGNWMDDNFVRQTTLIG